MQKDIYQLFQQLETLKQNRYQTYTNSLAAGIPLPAAVEQEIHILTKMEIELYQLCQCDFDLISLPEYPHVTAAVYDDLQLIFQLKDMPSQEEEQIEWLEDAVPTEITEETSNRKEEIPATQDALVSSSQPQSFEAPMNVNEDTIPNEVDETEASQELNVETHVDTNEDNSQAANDTMSKDTSYIEETAQESTIPLQLMPEQPSIITEEDNEYALRYEHFLCNYYTLRLRHVGDEVGTDYTFTVAPLSLNAKGNVPILIGTKDKNGHPIVVSSYDTDKNSVLIDVDDFSLMWVASFTNDDLDINVYLSGDSMEADDKMDIMDAEEHFDMAVLDHTAHGHLIHHYYSGDEGKAQLEFLPMDSLHSDTYIYLNKTEEFADASVLYDINTDTTSFYDNGVFHEITFKKTDDYVQMMVGE